MKRLLSIFMLLAMLFVGVGPTIGWHFCGDKLHAVELLSKEKSCCAESPLTAHDAHANMNKTCCETKEIQFKTDSYQVLEEIINLSHSFALDITWLIAPTNSQLAGSDQITTLLKHFSPNGYDIKNINILEYICILRI